MVRHRDYEPVALTDVVGATLPWVAGLRDPLTATVDQPDGQPLGVGSASVCIYKGSPTYFLAMVLGEGSTQPCLVSLSVMALEQGLPDCQMTVVVHTYNALAPAQSSCIHALPRGFRAKPSSRRIHGLKNLPEASLLLTIYRMVQTHLQNEWAGRPCSTYAEHVAATLEEAPKRGGFIKLPKMLLVAFQLTTCGSWPVCSLGQTLTLLLKCML